MDRNDYNHVTKGDVSYRGAGKEIEKYRKRSVRYAILSSVLFILLVAESFVGLKVYMTWKNTEHTEKSAGMVPGGENAIPTDSGETQNETNKGSEKDPGTAVSKKINAVRKDIKAVLPEDCTINCAFAKLNDNEFKYIGKWPTNPPASDLIEKEFVLGAMYSELCDKDHPFSPEEEMNREMALKALHRKNDNVYSDLSEDHAKDEIVLHIGGYRDSEDIQTSTIDQSEGYNDALNNFEAYGSGIAKVEEYAAAVLGSDKKPLDQLTVEDGMDFMKALATKENLQIENDEIAGNLQARFQKEEEDNAPGKEVVQILDNLDDLGDRYIMWIAETYDSEQDIVIYANTDGEGGGYVAAIRYNKEKDVDLSTLDDVIKILEDKLVENTAVETSENTAVEPIENAVDEPIENIVDEPIENAVDEPIENIAVETSENVAVETIESGVDET